MGTRPRMLIVEDGPVVAEGLILLLHSLAMHICGVAVRSTEGLALERERRPDVVLTNVNLADGISGIDLAERLHHEQIAPVIFRTAEDDPTRRRMRGRNLHRGGGMRLCNET